MNKITQGALRDQIERLSEMTLAELRDLHAEVFGEETTARHKRYLERRIAWGIQARAEGGLSERAKARARELADETDLRLLAPERTEVHEFRPAKDRRLPLPGAVLTREYKGETIAVTVLDDGFECRGERYRSLSAVAKAITGSHWNGYGFFGLTGDSK